MQFLLLICEAEQRFANGFQGDNFAEYWAFGQRHADLIKGGNALQPTRAAKTVRVRSGESITTDGSFGETTEEAMQNALAAALIQWNKEGLPAIASAWITAVAHRTLVDYARRKQTQHLGLLALMLLQDSLSETRVAGDGELVLLEEQDRSLWNVVQIEEGVQLVQRALRLRNIGLPIASGHCCRACRNEKCRRYRLETDRFALSGTHSSPSVRDSCSQSFGRGRLSRKEEAIAAYELLCHSSSTPWNADSGVVESTSFAGKRRCPRSAYAEFLSHKWTGNRKLRGGTKVLEIQVAQTGCP